jgi:hypothetical protein
MRKWHSERAASAGKELSAAAAQLEQSLAEVLPRGSFQIQHRVKSLPSLFEKVRDTAPHSLGGRHTAPA